MATLTPTKRCAIAVNKLQTARRLLSEAEQELRTLAKLHAAARKVKADVARCG